MEGTERETVDEGYFYVMSNGSEDFYPDNSLSAFSNVLPHKLTSTTNSYEVALSEIIFNNEFASAVLPKKDNVPTFIFAKEGVEGKQTFGDFGPDNLVFLPRGEYTLPKLLSALEVLTSHSTHGSSALPLIAAYDKELHKPCMGVYKNIKGKQHSTFLVEQPHLLVFKQLADYIVDSTSLVLPVNNKGTAVVDGHVYEVYALSPKSHHYFALNTSWRKLPTHFKSVAFIECPHVEKHPSNSKLVAQLGNIALPENIELGQRNGFHCEFNTPIYFSLSTTQLQAFQVRLVDSEGEQLKLAPGPATVLKFHLRRRLRKNMSRHYVQVTSTKDSISTNTNYKFESRLPFPLRLHSDSTTKWYVAVSSMILPSRFDLLLSEEDRIMVINVVDVRNYTFVLPHFSRLQEVCDAIIHETNNHVMAKVNEVTGGLEVTSEFAMRMTVRKKLFHTLGGNVVENDMHIIQVNRLGGVPFIFPRPPRYELHLPTSVFLYAGFVDQSPLSGKLMKILRIVDLNSSADGGEQHQHLLRDFKNLEFHEVSTDLLDNLTFELRTHYGSYVNFSSESKIDVILNLVFQKRNKTH